MHIRRRCVAAFALAALCSALSTVFWMGVYARAFGGSPVSEVHWDARIRGLLMESRPSDVLHGSAPDPFSPPATRKAPDSGQQNENAVLDRPLDDLQQWELRRAYGIAIPDLNVRSPVLFPSRRYWDDRDWDLLEKQLQVGLLYGAVAYPHSGRPGKKSALFIAGHSSPPNALAKESLFGDVFARLPDIALGSIITITDGEDRHRYVVADTLIVDASQTAILQVPDGSEGMLTLITCYPVGTTRQRFVVRAQHVSID
jgi:LPXTG-site transpeptidase (sortase) family protein